MKGKLYLIPTVLAEGTLATVLPPIIPATVQKLSYFVCENIRTARRFVGGLRVHPSVEALNFELLDKDTRDEQLPKILEPLQRGINMGLLSESGCPAIADPGALAVGFAHRNGIIVVPLVGPSSLMLALMASGLNGQRFAFHGYLPVESKDAASAIRSLERESAEKDQTQIFIETPYRNNKLLGHMIRTLHPTTRLCVASNLTAADENIRCMPVSEWKKQSPELEKAPATFLFLAASKHAVNT
jgi:16S rRNA (cytidine1402-2'-O)-methyltransferase